MSRSEAIAAAGQMRRAGMTWKAIARRLGEDDWERLRQRYRHDVGKVKQPKTMCAYVRFPEDHVEVLRREAFANGMTIAGLVRQIVRGHIEKP